MVTITPSASPLVQQPRLGFRPDIQGLRAVAVLLVVIYHAGVSFFSGGYIGVDVFFVISGFLITTHLLESLHRDGIIRLGQFYAKRARRILPASLVVVALTVAAAVVWMPPLQLESVFKGAIATAFYVPNMLFAREGTNYLAETAPSVFQHYWSLGIEEQFYLLWPLALILIFRALKSERATFWAVAVLVLASFALCLVVMPLSQPWAFFSLPTRAWELGIGALMAFVMRSHGERFASARSGALAWVGLVALLVIGITYNSETPFPGYFAAAPVVATAMIIAGGRGRSGPAKLLSTRPMQFVGLISYSLYLVHWPILVIPQAATGLGHNLPLWVTLGLGALSFPAAYALHRFVEDPARRYGPLARSRPLVTLIAVGAATALVVLTSVAAMLFIEQRPLHAGKPVAAATQIQVLPVGTNFVPANLEPNLRSAASDNPLVYSNGCHRDNDSFDASGCHFGTNLEAPLVALFGDSHAASWFPALHQMALDGQIRLVVHTKSACPSVDMEIIRFGVTYTSCATWRTGVIEELGAQQPNIILLANKGSGYVDLDDSQSVDAWSAGLSRMVRLLPEDARVGVIADVPNMGQTPAICLSAHLENAHVCGVSRNEGIYARIVVAEQRVAQDVGAEIINLTDYLCNATFCPAIINDHLVYRDSNHLTASMSELLGEPLWQRIVPLLD